jgi:SAM-dependent methyltransferase
VLPNLSDKLHCPRCKGRLTAVAAADPAASWPGVQRGGLHCSNCDTLVPVIDGIADFVGDRTVPDGDPYAFGGDPRNDDAASAALLEQIRTAAAERWPVSLGEVLELGCGGGQMTRNLAGALHAEVRGLLVADTAMDMVRRSRDRLAGSGLGMDGTVLFACLSGQEDAIRDAVADTVVGTAVVSRFGDVRGFLAMAHRVLKAGGRALFVVPNRRCHQAFCQAAAAALVRQFARDRVWTDGGRATLQMLADLRLQLVHQGDRRFLSGLRDKHLFDSEALEDMALEVGFATVDVMPLQPDPLGAETTRRLCQDAAVADEFTGQLAPLAASAGAIFFGLLSRQDASASMLLWLTKGIGPRLRTFSARPPPPAIGVVAMEYALGGAPPRWSIELAARDTSDGVVVSLGGWCLVNTDVVWVRLRLDDVSREAPVWRPRPDVHEVLNFHGLYHPLNALCCGMAAELLFDGVHPQDNRCRLQVEVVLASGLIARGPAPDVVIMNEPMIIAQ